MLLGLGLGALAWGAPPATEPTQSVPASSRTLATDVNPPAGGEYDAAFRLAHPAGAQAVSLSIPWDQFELTPGPFAPDPHYLSIANLYYPGYGTSLALTLAPIDTNRVRVAQNLAPLGFDDPRMIARFNLALEQALNRLADT